MTLSVEPELCSQYSDWTSAWTIRGSSTGSGKISVSSLKRPDQLSGANSADSVIGTVVFPGGRGKVAMAVW